MKLIVLVALVLVLSLLTQDMWLCQQRYDNTVTPSTSHYTIIHYMSQPGIKFLYSGCWFGSMLGNGEDVTLLAIELH